jgi:ATP-binding cassette subfamily B protein
VRVVKNSIQLIKFRYKLFIGSVLLNIIFLTLPLVTTLIIREIYDNLQGIHSFSINIWYLVGFIPVTYGIRVLALLLSVIFMWAFSLSCMNLLRKNMIRGIFDKPGAQALPKTSGEAISRLRGDVEEVAWFTNFISVMISFGLFAVIAFILMFSINVTATTAILVPFVLLVIGIIITRSKIAVYRKKNRKATGKVTSAINEIFGSIRTIKVTSAENNILMHFKELNNERKRAAVKDDTYLAIVKALYEVTISVSMGIMLILVVQELRSGKFTLGDLFLFMYLIGWLTGFVGNFGELISWYQGTNVAYNRMTKLIVGGKEHRKDTGLIEHGPIYVKEDYPLIEKIVKTDKDVLKKLNVKNLSYTYPGSTNGIRDINFDITEGSFTVVTGRIGCGKTTLLRCLLGLLPKDEGDIYWNEKLVEDLDSFFIPPRSAYTPQVPHLFSDSVKSNILMGVPEESINIDEALHLAVVEEDVRTFVDKLETSLGPKGVKLSGGQKHRIAAARMFGRNAELFVFDDISSALDVKTEQNLWRRVFEKTNATFLITSHRKSALQRADQIIVLDNGKIVGIGTLNELLNNCEEMQNLWETELEETIKPVEVIEEYPMIYTGTDDVSRLLTSLESKIPLVIDRITSAFSFSIPETMQISSISKNLWQELLHTALADQIITEDEHVLLEKIMKNIELYGKILDDALEDRIITKKEKKMLVDARTRLWRDAYDTVYSDLVITGEEMAILDKLRTILSHLEDFEGTIIKQTNR